MNTLPSYNRSKRFSSPNTELWNIGAVNSHPPRLPIEPSYQLEEELLHHGYQNELNTIDGRGIKYFLEEKFAHPRHIRMIEQFGDTARLSRDELLAIACFTGLDVYRDVRRSTAAGDWNRWPSFIKNLIKFNMKQWDSQILMPVN
jgi:hypothetical protein